jgi:hypothetical protein
MADKDLRAVVKQALKEGANPDGFTGDVAAEFAAIQAERKEAAEKAAATRKKNEEKEAKAAAKPAPKKKAGAK